LKLNGDNIIDLVRYVFTLSEIPEILKNINLNNPKENNNPFYHTYNDIHINVKNNRNHIIALVVLENKLICVY